MNWCVSVCACLLDCFCVRVRAYGVFVHTCMCILVCASRIASNEAVQVWHQIILTRGCISPDPVGSVNGHACVCACVRVCVRACVCACVFVCMCACICVFYTYRRVRVWMGVSVFCAHAATATQVFILTVEPSHVSIDQGLIPTRHKMLRHMVSTRAAGSGMLQECQCKNAVPRLVLC